MSREPPQGGHDGDFGHGELRCEGGFFGAAAGGMPHVEDIPVPQSAVAAEIELPRANSSDGHADLVQFRASIERRLAAFGKRIEPLLIRLRTLERASSTWGVANITGYGRQYPADYDRRHAASLFGTVWLTRRLDFGATLRVASGFPGTPAAGIRVAATPTAGPKPSAKATAEAVLPAAPKTATTTAIPNTPPSSRIIEFAPAALPTSASEIPRTTAF